NTGRPASSDTEHSMTGASSSEMPVYVYTQIGTEGIGAGYGMRLNPSWVIRAEANMMNYSKTSDKSGISSDMKLKLRSEGVYADYYPIENSPVRVTGGIMLNQTKARFNAVAPAGGATATFNGTSYALAAGESVTGNVEASPV